MLNDVVDGDERQAALLRAKREAEEYAARSRRTHHDQTFSSSYSEQSDHTVAVSRRSSRMHKLGAQKGAHLVSGDIHIPVRVADGFEDYDDLPPPVDFYNVAAPDEDEHSRTRVPVDDAYAASVAAARAAQDSVFAEPTNVPAQRLTDRSLPRSTVMSTSRGDVGDEGSARSTAVSRAAPVLSTPSTPHGQPASSRPRPKERALDLVSAWAVPCFRKRQNSLAVRVELTDYGEGGTEQTFAVIVTLTGFPKHEVVRTYAQFEDLSNEVAMALPDLSDDAPLFPAAPKKTSKLFKNTLGCLCAPCFSCGTKQWATCCAQLDLYLKHIVAIRRRLPCSLFWRIAAFCGLTDPSFVDTLAVWVVPAATGPGKGRHRRSLSLALGTNRGTFIQGRAVVVTLYSLCELRTLLRASGICPLAPFPVDLSEHDDPTRDTVAAATIDVWLSEVLSQWWQLPEPVKLRLSHLLEMEAPPQADGRMVQMSVGRASDDSRDRNEERARAARAFQVDMDGDGYDDTSPIDGQRQMAQSLLSHQHVPGV